MSNKFDPKNKIIKLCMLGMNKAEEGDIKESNNIFLKAWDESTDDFEKFIVAFQLGKYEKDNYNKLKWMEMSLKYALKSNDNGVKSAFSTIYLNIAKCYKKLGDFDKYKINLELSNSSNTKPDDEGPFYHGTKADLNIGDLLVAGRNSNYESDLKMNHIYFTSNLNGAVLAATLAKGNGEEHIYIVKPTGNFENDPNVTDKKFPGNLTCSYRSQEPLLIVGEKTDWIKTTQEERNKWHEKLANNTGKIIN